MPRSVADLYDRWRRKFAAAFSGLFKSIAGEDSFAVHLAASVAVLGVATWLQLSAIRWAILTLTIACVFAAELFNTSIEKLAKAIHPDQHAGIGRSLDAAAAGVLVLSIGAIIIGLIVIGQPLYQRSIGG